MANKRVAVIGASGYGGLQTLRLLHQHPALDISFLGGERSSGKRWSELVPFLPLAGDPVVQTPDPDAIAAAADFAVLSLPNGLAAQLVPPLLQRGVRVVDLSADYRFSSLSRWQEVYASEAREVPRSDDDLCAEAVYGLPEWEAEAIRTARLIAAPGCFPTAAGAVAVLEAGSDRHHRDRHRRQNRHLRWWSGRQGAPAAGGMLRSCCSLWGGGPPPHQ